MTVKLKLAEKLTHTVFTASQESFRLSSQKVIVTGHGIDTDLFKPTEKLQEKSTVLNILSVGRISRVKNYETLIKAAKVLEEKGFSFEIHIIGEIPMEKDKDYGLLILNKIKEVNLIHNLIFMEGKVNHEDLIPYYQDNDLFVHLSKTGSLDKSLLEAMASGIKVLSSNDWSRNNLPSELVFKENDPIDLANKIQNIPKTDFRTQLRNYVVKNHNLDNLIAKISSVIQK